MIDVREKDERDEGYIPGSRNVPYRLMRLCCPDLPRDRPVVTICGSGPRAAIAASILRGKGIDARPVVGGGHGRLARPRPDRGHVQALRLLKAIEPSSVAEARPTAPSALEELAALGPDERQRSRASRTAWLARAARTRDLGLELRRADLPQRFCGLAEAARVDGQRGCEEARARGLVERVERPCDARSARARGRAYIIQ